MIASRYFAITFGTLSLGLVATIGLTAQGDPDPQPLSLDDPELIEIRTATERFQAVDVALAEGYVFEPICVDAEMEGMPRQLGAMGLHYFRPDLLGVTEPPNPRVKGNGTHTDFRNPAVLIYEPQADGSLMLTAIENLVFMESWHAAGNTAPPEYRGHQYYTMIDNPRTAVDEAHGFEPHYELHMWLYKENPTGLLAQFNPRNTCEHFEAPAGEGHATH